MPVNQPDSNAHSRKGGFVPKGRESRAFRTGWMVMLALFCTLPLSAQQEGNQITHFMYNTYSYNPGFAGFSNGICATALHRQQWIGIGKGLGSSTQGEEGSTSESTTTSSGSNKITAPNKMQNLEVSPTEPGMKPQNRVCKSGKALISPAV